MNPNDMIQRAEQSASLCDAQGFFATARSLRALAEEMELSNWLIGRFHEARLHHASKPSSET